VRKQYVYLIGIGGLLVALVVGTMVSAANASTQHLERWYYRGTLPITGGPPRLGIPAIQPPAGNGDQRASTFTVKDVEAYVATHQSLGRARVNGPVTVAKVEFLPTQKVNERLKTTISPADGTLLCLVQLRGAFTAAAPPGANGRSFPVAYQVFDARTGNLLVEAG